VGLTLEIAAVTVVLVDKAAAVLVDIQALEAPVEMAVAPVALVVVVVVVAEVDMTALKAVEAAAV
jgi:hypothetical protein